VRCADSRKRSGECRGAGHHRHRLLTGALALLLASGGIWGCAAVNPESQSRMRPPGVGAGHVTVPTPGRSEVGLASWYGAFHQGQLTASGEPFDMNRLTAAHRTLPLGTRLRVTNLENGRVVRVRVNDRGPWVSGRILDLSREAARLLDMMDHGVVPVRLEVDRV
jgi:rare lipoprotein A